MTALRATAMRSADGTANVQIESIDLTVIYCTAAIPCYAYAVNNKWIREFDAVVDALVAA